MNRDYNGQLNDLADVVYDHPESGFEEYESSRAQVAFLKEQGFTVEENVADTITGYKATYGSGHPVIAFLGEFDALYGLGQVADLPQYQPNGREMGHGCGHHLLGTGAIGAGLMVRDYLMENNRQGTVLIIGCPAEESGSGKAYMARDGVFADVDIALTWHPSNFHMVCTGSSQSCIQCYFRFHGIASHAAGSPEKGRSALDAVELTDIGVNYLREHMESTDRVHYAITDTGGRSPNVVQAEAEVKYLIRSTTNGKCQKLFERVCDIARGAALMTGTKLDIIFDEGLSNTVINSVLEGVMAEAFAQCGAPVYSQEEREYAAAFKASYEGEITPEDVPFAAKDKRGLLVHMREEPLCDHIVETYSDDRCEMGSTDVGDVSWVVPTATLNTACYSYGAGAHSWQWVAQGKSSIAHKGMNKAAEVLALTAEKLYENPELIEQAKKELAERLDGDVYQCLIPQGIKPHIPGE